MSISNSTNHAYLYIKAIKKRSDLMQSTPPKNRIMLTVHLEIESAGKTHSSRMPLLSLLAKSILFLFKK